MKFVDFGGYCGKPIILARDFFGNRDARFPTRP